MNDPRQIKDIKYISIHYLAGKETTKITLANTITRQEALEIAALIEPNKQVEFVTCWTENNTFI